MYKRVYRIDPITIEINSDDRNEELMSTFQYCKSVQGASDDRKIVINIFHKDIEPKIEERFYSLSGSVAFNKDEYIIKGHRFSYSVKNLFNRLEDTIVNIYWNSQNAVKTGVMRIANSIRPSRLDAHSKREEEILHITHYGCLWYIVAISLMKYDSVFVHAGVVSKNGRAVMLAGSGGCGKTSTIMDFLKKDGWQYISEDFAIVHKSGIVYPFPRKMAIYSSDLRFGNITLNEAISKNLTNWERFKWSFLVRIGKDPLYHLPPQMVFKEEKIATSADLDKVLFMSRVPKGYNFKFEDIQIDSIVDRITDSSYRELKEVFEVICNIRANGDQECLCTYPSLNDLMALHRDILAEALSKASKKLVRVPLDGKPSNILEEVAED